MSYVQEQASDRSDMGDFDQWLTRKVTVVHDYLTQRGGAERVTLAILQAFPNARLVTSLYDPERTFPDFQDYSIQTLWTNRVSPLKRSTKAALPLLPNAFGRHLIDDGSDLVICSSSGWSHAVRTAMPKMVYCHNTARWLYQSGQYFPRLGPSGVRAWKRATGPLRSWDRRAALSATKYVVNSRAVQERVRSAYDLEPAILPPPGALSSSDPQTPVAGVEPGYLLVVGRQRAYKNIDVVAAAVSELPDERLLIVGRVPPPTRGGSWPSNINQVSEVSDAQLRWAYANADALVSMSFEDFGLTPLEGWSFGKPAVLLRYGGFLDTNIEGVTGEFADAPNVDSVQAAVRRMRNATYQPIELQQHAAKFQLDQFQRRIREQAGGCLGLRHDQMPNR